MTPGPWRRALVRNELRALLPMWLAVIGTVAAAGAAHDPRLFAAALATYALGSVALGAMSMGQEYASRTVALLFALPVDRWRLLAVKSSVLALALLTVHATAWAVFFINRDLHAWSVWRGWMMMLPLACGLFVAPLLTMVCRSGLAGAVFALAIPGTTAVVCELLGVLVLGPRLPEVEAFRASVFRPAMVVVCLVSAVLSARVFLRLEAIDGTGRAVGLPRWLTGVARPRARRRHPMAMLLRKELHLQQLSLVVGALFVGSCVTLQIVHRTLPASRDLPLSPITVFYLLVLSMLIGALASSEERHFGTIESQLLLPIPAWQQWTVKAGMVVGLTLVLAVAPPLLLAWIGGDGELAVRGWWLMAGLAVVVAVASLYVSSLCSSGVKALLLSVPAILGAAAFIFFVGSSVERLAFRSGLLRLRPSASLALVSIIFVLAVLLVLGFRNHRTMARREGEVLRQGLAIASLLVLAILLQVGVSLF